MTVTHRNDENCSIVEFGGKISPNYGDELVDSDVRNNHLLNFQSKALAGHHLISNCVVSHLSSTRKQQFQDKGWSINYGFNVVLLPAIPKISCHYEIPCHETCTFHMESGIFSDFYSKKSKTYGSRRGRYKKEFKTINKGDKDLVSGTRGYHKVVALKLALILKDLNCKSNYKEYVKALDRFSIQILMWLSTFDLLLTVDGRQYHRESYPGGCGQCKPPREHFKIGQVKKKPVLDKLELERYLKSGREDKYYKDVDGNEFIYLEKESKKGELRKLVYKLEEREVPPKDIVEEKYWSTKNRLKTVYELKNERG